MHAFAFFLERSIDLRAVQALYLPIFVKIFFYLKSVHSSPSKLYCFLFHLSLPLCSQFYLFDPIFFSHFQSCLILLIQSHPCSFLAFTTSSVFSYFTELMSCSHLLFFSIFSILSKPFSLFFCHCHFVLFSYQIYILQYHTSR